MQNFKILTLNCQKGYQPDFKQFIQKILSGSRYDFVLLQEVNKVVLSILTDSQSSYSILNPFDKDLGENTHVCILHRNIFVLKENFFLSFAKFDPKMSPRGWGFLAGVFECKDKNIVIGSVHLHPGIRRSLRFKELGIIKGKLVKYLSEESIVILGGDFNFGFRNEILISEKILSPELVRVKGIGATLDSRYTEKAPFLLNKLSVFLARFGIGFTFQTDHFYINSLTTHTYQISCNRLPDRVSDHCPVELVILSRDSQASGRGEEKC